jgi:Bacterial Ig-like domain (group 2)
MPGPHPVRLPVARRRPIPAGALALALLLLAAPNRGCSFSIGPNGLCAGLRLDPARSVLRVGQGLRVTINADACSASAGCPCADSALDGARWSSAAPATATVDGTGYVVARRPGTTTIVLVPRSSAAWHRTRIAVTVVP